MERRLAAILAADVVGIGNEEVLRRRARGSSASIPGFVRTGGQIMRALRKCFVKNSPSIFDALPAATTVFRRRGEMKLARPAMGAPSRE